MLRRLFTIASVLSLLLLLGMSFLWMQTYKHRSRVKYARRNHPLVILESSGGKFVILTLSNWTTDVPLVRTQDDKPVGIHVLSWGAHQVTQHRDAWLIKMCVTGDAAMVDRSVIDQVSDRPFRFYVLGYVGIAGALAILPAAWLFAYVVIAVVKGRRARLDPNQPRCAICNYNLTGNTSGVCPECGTAHKGDRVVSPSGGSLG